MEPLNPTSLKDFIPQAVTQPSAYILCSEDLSYFYKGAARNLCERLKDHRAGRVSRTKNRRPLLVAYVEPCETFSEALRREKYFKSGAGREWLKRRLSVNQAG